MADYRVPSQQANDPTANTFPHPALHQPHGQVQRVANTHGAGYDHQNVHQEGIPEPVGNVAMQGEMQYPHHIGAPHYNAIQYHPSLSPHPGVPYMHLHQDVVAQGIPVQAHPLAPEVQENHNGHFGYGAQYPAPNPPEDLPGVWPHPAPPANMPPVDGLRSLASRYLNNPDTCVNGLRIEPGPGGRFEVCIALELTDIF